MPHGVSVLDADVATDAHRLLNRALGLHADTPRRFVPPHLPLTPDDAADVQAHPDEWTVTRAPADRHLLILGQLEPPHLDRLDAPAAPLRSRPPDDAEDRGDAPKSAAFSVLLRASDTAMHRVRVIAPAGMFAGTVLDCDAVLEPPELPEASEEPVCIRKDGSGRFEGVEKDGEGRISAPARLVAALAGALDPCFTLHVLDAVWLNGAPARSTLDAETATKRLSLHGSKWSTAATTRPWHPAKGAPFSALLDGGAALLFARSARVRDIAAPRRELLRWTPLPLRVGVKPGENVAFVADRAGHWLPAPSLQLERAWAGAPSLIWCDAACKLGRCVLVPSSNASSSVEEHPMTLAQFCAATLPFQLQHQSTSSVLEASLSSRISSSDPKAASKGDDEGGSKGGKSGDNEGGAGGGGVTRPSRRPRGR